jgi:GT2 family glycosyltransferase
MMKTSKVLISILNWNKADETLVCLASLKTEKTVESAEVQIVVVDNGSEPADFAILENGVKDSDITLVRMPENLGFTGGHNFAIQKAFDEGYDFIWLLNNDAAVLPGTLEKLLVTMHSESVCGAVSPVIRHSHDEASIEGCVNLHDWKLRTTIWMRSIPECKVKQISDPESVWLIGTAILFRTAALRDTGLLDDRMFAYYDDNDIGARLSAAGWHSRCVFDASVTHAAKEEGALRPLYYHYLMQRNQMLFWHKNTPARFRRLLWLKLIDTALHNANRLYARGLYAQGDAALLGGWDFIVGKFGAPKLGRSVPLPMRLASKLSALRNRQKLKSASISSSPTS